MGSRSLSEGKPLRLILAFAIPLMIGNFFQQVYTMVDAMVVSYSIGTSALAALGATDWILWLLNGLIVGISQGFSVHLSLIFGQNNPKEMQKCVAACIVGCFILWGVVSCCSYSIVVPLLRFLKTPVDIMPLSLAYLNVIFSGFLGVCLFNLWSGMLRAVGNSHVPLVAMVISSLSNVALDFLFVVGLHWGIQGAAFATVLSQLISALICFIAMIKMEEFHLEREDFRGNGKRIFRILKLSLPLSLNNCIIGFGGLGVQSVINSFGTLFVAGMTATGKFIGLVEIIAMSFGYAMMSYCGQNLGAKKIDRIETGVRQMMIFELFFSLCLAFLLYWFRQPILSLFVDANSENASTILGIAKEYLSVYAFTLPFLYIMNCYRSSVMGLQETLMPMISGVVQLLMRFFCAFVLTQYLGRSGLYYAEGAAWFGAGIMMFGVYHRLLNRFKKE